MHFIKCGRRSKRLIRHRPLDNGLILLHSLRWRDKHGSEIGIYTGVVAFHLALPSNSCRCIVGLFSVHPATISLVDGIDTRLSKKKEPDNPVPGALLRGCL